APAPPTPPPPSRPPPGTAPPPGSPRGGRAGGSGRSAGGSRGAPWEGRVAKGAWPGTHPPGGTLLRAADRNRRMPAEVTIQLLRLAVSRQDVDCDVDRGACLGGLPDLDLIAGIRDRLLGRWDPTRRLCGLGHE